MTGAQGATGATGPTGPAGQDGGVGISNFEILNSNSGWTAVAGESNTYEMSMFCNGTRSGISVGVNGLGAMNNVISMAIVGSGDEGYFRVRLRAGSQPSDVTAQLMCADIAN